MTIIIRLALILPCLLPVFSALAQTDLPRQDPGAVRTAVEQFLRTQSVGLPGEVTIEVGPIDPRLNLPRCPVPEAFLPKGSRLWGKSTVGVRCTVPAPWTIYVSATVRVSGDYVAVAVPLSHGQLINANDLVTLQGDLTALPNGIITDPAAAIGRTAAMSLQAGAPLRRDAIRQQPAVLQGQIVRIISIGPGFRVSTEGRALASGGEGQIVQARTLSGQVVSGIAKAGGIMEVAY